MVHFGWAWNRVLCFTKTLFVRAGVTVSLVGHAFAFTGMSDSWSCLQTGNTEQNLLLFHSPIDTEAWGRCGNVCTLVMACKHVNTHEREYKCTCMGACVSACTQVRENWREDENIETTPWDESSSSIQTEHNAQENLFHVTPEDYAVWCQTYVRHCAICMQSLKLALLATENLTGVCRVSAAVTVKWRRLVK